MRQPDLIADYAANLAYELRFDPRLARRAQVEIEDHLWQAAGEEAGSPTLAAQRRAIAAFGDAREIARQYAAAALLARMRRVAVLTCLSVSAVFAAMELRLGWYGSMPIAGAGSRNLAQAIGLVIDRGAYAFAILGALVSCGYVLTRRSPAQYHAGFDKEIGRSIALCAMASGGLILSVATESVLAPLRLANAGMGMSSAALIAVLSLIAEVGGAMTVIVQIRALARRAATASSLLLR